MIEFVQLRSLFDGLEGAEDIEGKYELIQSLASMPHSLTTEVQRCYYDIQPLSRCTSVLRSILRHDGSIVVLVVFVVLYLGHLTHGTAEVQSEPL